MLLTDEDREVCQEAGMRIMRCDEEEVQVEYPKTASPAAVATAPLSFCCNKKISGYLALDVGDYVNVQIMYVPV